ncbi:MAG: hypothetical protein ABEI74_03845 [Candidatus Pacearchaeota archaeon]
MADNKVSTPAGFGGLMSYSEEYNSKYQFRPEYVLMFVILIIGLRILMPVIF